MDTSFERTHDGTEEWITPPNIVLSLGDFDLDPCAAVNQPYRTAATQYTILDDGLSLSWFGRVNVEWLVKCGLEGKTLLLKNP